MRCNSKAPDFFGLNDFKPKQKFIVTKTRAIIDFSDISWWFAVVLQRLCKWKCNTQHFRFSSKKSN